MKRNLPGPEGLAAGGASAVLRGLAVESATACESNRIDADVNQHFQAVRAANGYGVRARRQGHNLTVARCQDDSVRRVNRETIAEHAPCEDLIRHLVQRRAPASEWRDDLLHVP